jgi:hypothetical protein
VSRDPGVELAEWLLKVDLEVIIKKVAILTED